MPFETPVPSAAPAGFESPLLALAVGRGTAYTDREDATRVKGPTGIGVRLFSEFVLGRQGSGAR